MAISAAIDLTKSPPTLTVTSDKRSVTVTVSCAGETATGVARYPVTVSDSSGKVWKAISDDGTTAVYT